MTIPYSVMTWIGVALFLILFLVAVAHVIQGFRFANKDQHILYATLGFLLTFTIITGIGLLLMREVDWAGSWSVVVPSTTEGSTQ